MHSALDRRDAVGVAVDALVVPGVPLQGDVQRLVGLGRLVVGDLREQRLAGGVQVLHEVDDAALVLIGDLLLLVAAFIDEHDFEVLVQKCHRLQSLGHRARDELDTFSRKDRRVRPERDRRAGHRLVRRSTNLGEFAFRLAAVDELLAIPRATAIDFGDHALGERVHHAHTYAVQTTGNLVAISAELAARVQHGEHDFECTLAFVWTARIRIYGDSTAVVADRTATVVLQGDRDLVAEACHGLVDGVVDDFPDQVMESGEARRADVHARTLANRVESLEDLDVLCAIRGGASGGGFGGFRRGHQLPIPAPAEAAAKAS